MKKIILAILIYGILFFGCLGKTETAKLVEQQLNLAGVENAEIIKEGKIIEVKYSPYAVNYEAEIIAEWGIILGVLNKMYPDAEKYKIIQQIDNTDIMTLIVNASDVKKFSEGKIDIYEFKSRIKIFSGRK